MPLSLPYQRLDTYNINTTKDNRLNVSKSVPEYDISSIAFDKLTKYTFTPGNNPQN